MPTQQREIEDAPTSEEVRKTLKKLPKSKFPTLDGMAVKVLLACLSFIQTYCLNMILQFWRNGILAYQTTTGIVKLEPKKIDKKRLKDWIPLTMLHIIYKLIAKILVGQLNPHCASLINSQQTRFIPRTYILENIVFA